MKDKWSDDIKEKISNYEIDPPEGLWEMVNSNLPGRREVRNYLWWSLVGAFALALTLVAFFIGRTRPQESGYFNTKGPIARVVLEEGFQCDLEAPSQLYDLKREVRTGEIGIKNGCCSEKSANPDNIKEGKAETSSKEAVEGVNAQKARYLEENKREVKSHAKPNDKKNARHYAFKLYSSIAGGYSRSSVSRSGFSSGLGMENANWVDDPALGVAVFNYGTAQKTEIKHDIPMKIGLAFSYELNDRFSLSAGISNVLLRSEYKEGTEHHYRGGEQNIRYIGVPLDVKYDFFTYNKSLNLYCTWGLSFDKCYKATRTNDYIIGDENRLKEREDLKERPFQFSTSLNLGVEYCLYDGVWAFAQAGIGYYFYDASSLNTIYKYRPANFSLGAGLRIDMSFTR